MKFKSVQKLHDFAISYSYKALVYEGKNDLDKAKVARKIAFCAEKEAATICHNTTPHPEPTRTILFRSAGWIAFKAGMIEEAKEMLKMAKEGDWEHDAENVIELEQKIEKQQNKTT
jgi:hypothetical protein